MLDVRIQGIWDAEEVFSRLHTHPGFGMLDSSLRDGKLGEKSIFVVDPFMTLETKGKRIRITEGGRTEEHFGDPLAVLDDLLLRHRTTRPPDAPVFCGGAVGYFSYDLGRVIERIPEISVDDRDLPDIHLHFYHGALILEPGSGELRYADGDEDKAGARRLARLIDLLKDSVVPVPAPFRLTGDLTPNLDLHQYLERVDRIREYIRSGDIYQANMTLRYTAPFEGNPADLYRRLRRNNPAPFSAYLDCGDHHILSSSPERLVEVRGRTVRTRPIKGTMPRGQTPEEDERMRLALADSQKDRAELLMIVDLERNDLGHVAKTGSVSVPELFVIEPYKTVFHLVATVEATLRPDVSPGTLLRAVFPGGSITGAPKIRAMEIIEELEPTRRNVYTGAIGYLDFSGDLDLNIAIRTMIASKEGIDYQVGGGIVWDSDPMSEYEETRHKGRALREVLEHD